MAQDQLAMTPAAARPPSGESHARGKRPVYLSKKKIKNKKAK